MTPGRILVMVSQLLKHMNGSIDTEDRAGATLIFLHEAHADAPQSAGVPERAARA